jgi:hypothetical protein
MSIESPSLTSNRAVVIEIGDVPAGIALPEKVGYRFVAVDQRFRLLDGSRFRRLSQAELAARNLFAALTPEVGTERTRRRPRTFA